jgi:hypothetical protein
MQLFRAPLNAASVWKRPQRWQKRFTTSLPSCCWKATCGIYPVCVQKHAFVSANTRRILGA